MVVIFVLFGISFVFLFILSLPLTSSRSLSNLKSDGLEFARLNGLRHAKLMLCEVLYVDSRLL